MRPKEFDLTLPAGREKNFILEKDELLLLASPVYGGRLPTIVKDAFGRLTAGRRPVAPIVVFGNRAYEDALLELYDLCVSKGYDVVGAGAFVGEHSYSHVMGRNRPDPADDEKARCFGLALRQTLLGDASLDDRRLLIKGHRPYRKYMTKPPFVPTTTRKCANCLFCVKNCPVGAFQDGDPRKINEDKCILCAACIKLCPEGAKTIGDDDFLDDLAIMAAGNLDRKEPDTFLP
jgi:ferredoxin